MLQLEGFGLDRTPTSGGTTRAPTAGGSATATGATDCSGLRSQFATLNASFTTDLATARSMIDRAMAVQAQVSRSQWVRWNTTDGQFFMKLAADALVVGDLAGKIDGCAAPSGSISSLRASLKQNATDLIITVVSMNEAWSAMNWSKWLTLVLKAQNYKRIVARSSIWLVKAAAAAAAIAQQQAAAAAARAQAAAHDAAIVEAARVAQVAADAAARAAADAAAASDVEALIAAAEAADAAKPAYRKPWFWLAVGGGVLAVGTAAVLAARR